MVKIVRFNILCWVTTSWTYSIVKSLLYVYTCSLQGEGGGLGVDLELVHGAGLVGLHHHALLLGQCSALCRQSRLAVRSSIKKIIFENASGYWTKALRKMVSE